MREAICHYTVAARDATAPFHVPACGARQPGSSFWRRHHHARLTAQLCLLRMTSRGTQQFAACRLPLVCVDTHIISCTLRVCELCIWNNEPTCCAVGLQRASKRITTCSLSCTLWLYMCAHDCETCSVDLIQNCSPASEVGGARQKLTDGKYTK